MFMQSIVNLRIGQCPNSKQVNGSSKTWLHEPQPPINLCLGQYYLDHYMLLLYFQCERVVWKLQDSTAVSLNLRNCRPQLTLSACFSTPIHILYLASIGGQSLSTKHSSAFSPPHTTQNSTKGLHNGHYTRLPCYAAPTKRMVQGTYVCSRHVLVIVFCTVLDFKGGAHGILAAVKSVPGDALSETIWLRIHSLSILIWFWRNNLKTVSTMDSSKNGMNPKLTFLDTKNGSKGRHMIHSLDHCREARGS